MNVNKVILCGTLANDPSVAFVSDKGTQQVNFTLMLQEQGQGDQVFRTFVPCMAYGRSAEKIGDVQKGDVALIEGKLSWRAASKDGSKPGRLEVFVRDVEVEPQPALAAASEN